MIKYIALVVVAIVIIVVSGYIGLKREKRPQTVNKHTVERSVETKESVPAADHTQAPIKADSPEVISKPEVTSKELEYTDDEDDDEILPKEREDDKAPIVSKEKLIGGADVEWVKPEEKSPDNKFGLPPQ